LVLNLSTTGNPDFTPKIIARWPAGFSDCKAKLIRRIGFELDFAIIPENELLQRSVGATLEDNTSALFE
jgi:hypothetical protein